MMTGVDTMGDSQPSIAVNADADLEAQRDEILARIASDADISTVMRAFDEVQHAAPTPNFAIFSTSRYALGGNSEAQF